MTVVAGRGRGRQRCPGACTRSTSPPCRDCLSFCGPDLHGAASGSLVQAEGSSRPSQRQSIRSSTPSQRRLSGSKYEVPGDSGLGPAARADTPWPMCGRRDIGGSAAPAGTPWPMCGRRDIGRRRPRRWLCEERSALHVEAQATAVTFGAGAHGGGRSDAATLLALCAGQQPERWTCVVLVQAAAGWQCVPPAIGGHAW